MEQLFRQGLASLRIELADEAIVEELILLDELLRWNKKINLTSIRNPDDALEKHLLDSLAVMNYLRGGEMLLDVGSGGGFPGIPLAIANRSLQLVSVDSIGKKINFQKHIKRMLNLNNMRAEHSRIEELRREGLNAGTFDVVITRAFSSLEAIFDLTSMWVKTGGRLLALKGPEAEGETKQLEPHLDELGFGTIEIHHYQLPFSKAQRCIIDVSKN